MSDFYIPGIWSQRYDQLPPPERADVNQEADRRFLARTGVARTLDPRRDQALAIRWLRIRDEVMAQMAGKGGADTSRGLVLGLPAPMKNWSYLLLYNYDVGDPQPKPEHLRALNRAVGPMLKMKGMDLRVGAIGNASRTGSEAANQALSQRRAEVVDKSLRILAGPSVRFFKPGAAGEHDQVSTSPQYRDVWPQLQSLDEDERDRSVVVLVQWQPVGAADDYFDALKQAAIDWDKAFHLAAQRAAVWYLSGGFLLVIADYGPSPKVKGVPSPWNPWTGPPNSWTTTSPDGDAVMRAMRPYMLREIEQAARNRKLNMTRAEIEQRYEEWLKSPTNKWVN
jgi:outer membrane protein OmpA-like peptidoglycan-associated protein